MIIRMDPRLNLLFFYILADYVMICLCQSSTTMIAITPSPSSTAQVVQAFSSSSSMSNMTLQMKTSSFVESSSLVTIMAAATSNINQTIASSQVSSVKPKPTQAPKTDEDDKKEKKEKKEFIALISGCCAGGFFALVGTIVVMITHVKMEKEKSRNAAPLSTGTNVDDIKLNGYYISDNEGLQMNNYS